MSDPRYPIGPFVVPPSLSPAERAAAIEQIAWAPAALRRAVQGLDEARLATPYRDGGWTVRQVVHHVPDSHVNAYVRFKLALTEERPTIKPYDQARWAELADVTAVPVDVSLSLLTALHARWVALLRAMSDADFARSFVHPEMGRTLTLDQTLANYAWHGRHHTAHITTLRERRGW
jgi:uncharacterized damage-inducible protein DinB